MEKAKIYRTPEEWSKRYSIPKYHENKIIDGDYDKALAAKCENGTFVGKINEEFDVKYWRGIPFAKNPCSF